MLADAHGLEHIDAAIAVFEDLKRLYLAVLPDYLAIKRVAVVTYKVGCLFTGEGNLDISKLSLY